MCEYAKVCRFNAPVLGKGIDGCVNEKSGMKIIVKDGSVFTCVPEKIELVPSDSVWRFGILRLRNGKKL